MDNGLDIQNISIIVVTNSIHIVKTTEGKVINIILCDKLFDRQLFSIWNNCYGYYWQFWGERNSGVQSWQLPYFLHHWNTCFIIKSKIAYSKNVDSLIWDCVIQSISYKLFMLWRFSHCMKQLYSWNDSPLTGSQIIWDQLIYKMPQWM